MKTTTPDTRAAILNLLGITHDTYSTTVEQLGYGFAWHYTQHNEWSVNYLTKAAAYWNWWKKQWQLRDEVFVVEHTAYANTGSENELLELWLDHHDPQQVECYPSAFILQQAWTQMVEEVDKEKGGVLC